MHSFVYPRLAQLQGSNFNQTVEHEEGKRLRGLVCKIVESGGAPNGTSLGSLAPTGGRNLETAWKEFFHEYFIEEDALNPGGNGATLSGLTALTKMAQNIRAKGLLEKALEVSTALLDFRSQPENLGPDHNGTASLMPIVALLNEEKGSWKFAEDLWLSLFKWRKKELGLEHEQTTEAFLRYENAIRRTPGLMLNDDLKRRMDLLGQDHPLTLDIMQRVSDGTPCAGTR
jgi:hypothetical protein